MILRDDTDPTASAFAVDPNQTSPYPLAGTAKAASEAPGSVPPPPVTPEDRVQAERLLKRFAALAPQRPSTSPRERSQSNGDDFAAHYARPAPPPAARQVDDPFTSIEVSDTLADTSPPRLVSVTNPQFTALAPSLASVTTPGTQPLTQAMAPPSSRRGAAGAASIEDALRRALHTSEPASPDVLAAQRDLSTGLPAAARSRRLWVAIPLLVLTGVLLVVLSKRSSGDPTKMVTTTSGTDARAARPPREESTGEDIPPPPIDLPFTGLRATPPSTATADDPRVRPASSSAPSNRRPTPGAPKHDIAESYEYE